VINIHVSRYFLGH